MPDYNAGRATGEITITSDTRGAKEAQAAMAETRAEAAALDAQMGKVNETFDKNRQGHVVTAEQIVRHRGQLEELRRTYLRYYDDIQKATERRQQLETRLDEQVKKADERKEKAFRAAHDYMKQAEVDLEKAQRLDERYEAAKAKAEDLRQRASLQIQRAQEAEQRAVERSERAYEKYHTRLQAITLEVQKFNQAHLEATSGLSRFRTEAEKAGASLEKLSDKLSGIAKIMTNIGVYGLFGTGAAGALGIVGGGGLHELIVVAGAALEVMKDFSSALLLMPAVVGAAGLSLGTLAVAFHGVSEAMGSLENPAQFVQSLRELSPAAREAMVIIQSFVYAMRGARMEVQESLFKPLIQDIQPLIYTWLPQLMNAGKLIADQFGQSFHQVFQFLLDPQTINAFQQFTGNLVQGFQAARGAIQPFLEMIRTLSLVGSQVFVRIGQAITHIANEFNNWVQNAASSGRLLQMFNTLLDDFTRLAHIVRDIGIGIFNFFDIGEKKGMGFLQQIEQLAASFRQWTESAKGQASIANFFDLLNKSMEVAKPLLKLFAEGLSIVAGAITRLGIDAAPGLTAFFQSLVEALRQLAPHLVEIAPALNEFLTAFGKVLVEAVKEIGPQLPKFFKDFADALVEVAPLLPVVAHWMAELFKHLTPHEVEIIVGLALALNLLIPAISALGPLAEGLAVIGAIFGAIDAPVLLVIGVIALLVVGLILLVKNWDKVKEAIGHVTEKFGGMSGIIHGIKEAWDGFTRTIEHWWDVVTNAFGNAWDTVVNALGGLRDKIVGFFEHTDWAEIGRKILHFIAEGLKDVTGIGLISDALGAIGDLVSDFLHQKHSPTKKGPLSVYSTDMMGTKLATDYAAGITAGSPAVAVASGSLADTAARGVGGTTGTGGAGTGSGGIGGGGGGGSGNVFSSAGVTGISGQGPVSGFDQWINFITQDMQDWSTILKNAWQLALDITNTVAETLKVTASIWNYGDNPLTRPGGLFGPPITNQQTIPGVPNEPIPGHAPYSWGEKLPGAVNRQDQQRVPGVPNVGPTGVPFGQYQMPAPAGAPGGPAPSPVPPGTPAAGGANLYQDAQGNWHSRDPWWEGNIQAESGGNIAPTGNPTHFGLFQFSQSTWDGIAKQVAPEWVGKNPGTAPAEVQARMAQRLYDQNKTNLPGQWANPYVQAHPGGTTGTIWSAGQQAPAPAAPPPAAPSPQPADQAVAALGGINLSTIPVAAQKYANDCIDASARIILSHAGINKTEEELERVIAPGTNIVAQAVGLNALNAAGKYVAMAGSGGSADAMYNAIKTSIDRGVGAILNVAPGSSIGGRQFSEGHFIAVTGYDPATGRINLSDTARGTQYSVTAADAYQATRGRGIVVGTGTGPPPAGAPPAPAAPPPPPPPPTRQASDFGGVKLQDVETKWKTSDVGAGWKVLEAPGQAPVWLAPDIQEPKLTAGGIPDLVGTNLIYRYGKNGERVIVKAGSTPEGYKPDLAPGAGGGPSLAKPGQAPQPAAPAPAAPPPQQQGPTGPLGVEMGRTDVPAKWNPTTGGWKYYTQMGANGTRYQWWLAPGSAEHGFQKVGDAWVPGGTDQNMRILGNNTAIMFDPDKVPGEPPAAPPILPANAVRADTAGTGGQPVPPPGGLIGQTVLPFLNDTVQRWRDLIHQGAPGSPLDVALGGSPPPPGAPAPGEPGAPGPPAPGQPTGPLPGAGAPPHQYPEPGKPPAKGQIYDPHAGDWMSNPPDGWDMSQPIPKEIVKQHLGAYMTPEQIDALPPMYYAAKPTQPPTVVAAVPGSAAPSLQPVEGGANPYLTAPNPDYFPNYVPQPGTTFYGPYGSAPGQAGYQAPDTNLPQDTRSPFEQFSTAMSGIATIVGDGFKIFEDVIKDIQATAAIGDTLVRGVQNTEDIVHIIENVQQYIATAADVAGAVKDITGAIAGMIPSTGGADMGGAEGAQAALQAISAIAGIVQGAIQAVNEGITLGIEVYHELGKYAGFLFGSVLGGSLGTLGGNVRMLLNTRTGEIQAYSEDNPLNKNIIKTPFAQAYTQPPAIQNQNNQLNIYAGPGPSPMALMQDTMWMVNTGAPQVASVAAGSD